MLSSFSLRKFNETNDLNRKVCQLKKNNFFIQSQILHFNFKTFLIIILKILNDF